MTNRGSSLVQKADIFNGPIYMNIRGRQTMATTLGGVLSLVLVMIVLTQGTLQSLEMIRHTNPALLQMSEFQADPNKIGLNSTDQFIFAVAITIDGSFNNMSKDSLFTFNAGFNQYFRDSEGVRTKYKNQLRFAPCNFDNFSTEGFNPNPFVSNNLSYSFCPIAINYLYPNGSCPAKYAYLTNCEGPPEFNISGSYLGADFEFIQFNLTVCSPSTVAQFGVQCDTPENIDNIFQNSEIKFNLYYANHLVDISNHKSPSQTFFDSLYWDVSQQIYKVADIFIDQQTIQDFDSYYSGSKYHNTTSYSIDISKNREQQIPMIKPTYPSLQWNFRRSNFNLLTIRTYMKVQDVLANLGGFSKSIVFVFAIIAAGYVRYKYQMMLSNELYNFDAAKKKNSRSNDSQDLENNDSPSKGRNLNSSLSMQEHLLPMNNLTAREDPRSEEEKIKEFFEQDKESHRRVRYSELRYFMGMICCCRRKTYDDKLAEKARTYVEEDIDIIHVIQKLKEVDKLKMVLLTKDQRAIFDNISKPLVTEDNDHAIERDASEICANREDYDKFMNDDHNEKEEYKLVQRYTKLYMSYKRLTRDTDASHITSNRRLFNMLGEDLIKVFQKFDKELGENFDPRDLNALLWKYIQNDNKKNK